jgi:hypothetical protein
MGRQGGEPEVLEPGLPWQCPYLSNGNGCVKKRKGCHCALEDRKSGGVWGKGREEDGDRNGEGRHGREE